MPKDKKSPQPCSKAKKIDSKKETKKNKNNIEMIKTTKNVPKKSIIEEKESDDDESINQNYQRGCSVESNNSSHNSSAITQSTNNSPLYLHNRQTRSSSTVSRSQNSSPTLKESDDEFEFNRRTNFSSNPDPYLRRSNSKETSVSPVKNPLTEKQEKKEAKLESRPHINTQKSSRNNNMLKNIFLILIGFIIGFIVGVLFKEKLISFIIKSEPKVGISRHQTDFKKQLKLEFPNQKHYFYSNIISSYEHSILNGQDPSIIVLASNSENSKNTNCVARKLSKMLIRGDSNLEDSVINSTKLSSLNDEEAKEELDKRLVYIFQNLNEKIALIEDIQDLPDKSMILFHSYGDDKSNAKFKGIIIIFTFNFKGEIENREMSDKDMTLFIEQKLNDKLNQSFHYDQLNALFTRIANNLVLIQIENNCQ